MNSQASNRLVQWIDRAVYACLLLTFAFAPHSIKYAARFCTAATVLFAASLLFSRELKWHRLFRPVLIFLLLATLSTAFSSAPDWSWRRLGWFSLMLSVIVAARTIRTRTRFAVLVGVLLLSASAILVRVGWQYTHGIGVRLVGLPTTTALGAQLLPDDIIQTLNARPTRSPAQFRNVLASTQPDAPVVLGVARGAPIERVMVQVSRRDFDTALSAPGVSIARGHPIRAQAGFYHYVPFAGFMTVISLLAWGMALGAGSRSLRAALIVVAIAAFGAVAATLTRTYLVALLAGAFAAVWMVSGRRVRVVAVVACALALAVFTGVIKHERGLGWISAQDAGTQYRLEMWRDGIKLFRAHPLLGIGLDASFSGKWNIEAYKQFPLMSHFHSSPIQIAVDTGLPTLIAWVWIGVSLFIVLLRQIRRLPREEHCLRGVTLGVFAATVAFYVASLVHYNQGDGEVMILMSCLMGIVVAVDELGVGARRIEVMEIGKSPIAQPPAARAV